MVVGVWEPEGGGGVVAAHGAEHRGGRVEGPGAAMSLRCGPETQGAGPHAWRGGEAGAAQHAAQPVGHSGLGGLAAGW